MKRFALPLLLLSLIAVTSVQAQQIRPQSTNYVIPTDVQPVGGGEKAHSTNYTLDDTIGEANIGLSRSGNYALNAGYRQVEATSLSMNCTPAVNLGTVART